MRVVASAPVHRGMEKLDKEAFRSSVEVLAVQVDPPVTHHVLKAPAMRGYVLMMLRNR